MINEVETINHIGAEINSNKIWAQAKNPPYQKCFEFFFFFSAEILNLKSDKLNVSRSIFHIKYKYKQLLLFKLSSGVLTFFSRKTLGKVNLVSNKILLNLHGIKNADFIP